MKIKQSTLFVLFLMLTSVLTFAQRTITGKITDGSEGLAGASVSAKGTSRGVSADAEGNYSLSIGENVKVLVFSYVGYASQEIALGSSDVLDVVLKGGAALEEISVVGSRNATRTKTTSPVAVDVIPISQVVNEIGQVDVNQILTYLAPSFQSSRQAISDGTDHVDPAQLRGLGPDQVLVLVNGKRRHQSALVNVNGTVNRGTVGTDMNAIPATSIERIEILRDGAAAQYGSDAIAGVINIVLKKRTGLSGNVSYGQHATQYDKNYAVDKLAGKETTPVKATDGQTVQVGVNYGLKLGTKGFANITGEYTQRGATNRTGTYTGQIWPNVAGKDRSDSINTAKGLTRNDFDMRIGNSEVKGVSVMLNLEYALTSNFTAYAFGGYNNKKGNAAGFYRYPNAIPGAVRSNVLAVYPNGFLPEINSDVTDISAAVGIRGKIAGFNVDLSNTYGKNTFDYDISNSVNFTKATAAGFKTAFDAGGNSYNQNVTNLDFSKKLDVLSGFNIAFGAENRLEAFNIRAGEEESRKNYDPALKVAAGSQVFSGFLTENQGTNKRNNQAGYADLELDITKDLMVGAAARFENYSDFGTNFSYKALARYILLDIATLRASFSTGFRAPSLQQKFYAKTNTLFVTTTAGLVPVESGTFTNNSRVAEILGIPKLGPEISQSYAAGITLRPLKGLEITFDYYNIGIKNRIVLTNNFTGDTTLLKTQLLPEKATKEQIAATNALKTQLDGANAGAANVFTNAIETKSNGYEAVIAYTYKFSNDFELRTNIAGTFITNKVVKGSNNKPVVSATDVLVKSGQLGNYFNREDQSRIEVASPTDKQSATFNLKYKKAGLMLRFTRFGAVTYLDPTITTDATKFPKNAFNKDALETLDQTFGAKITTDITASYGIAKGLTISVGANNLLDVYQDVHTHSGNMGLGRFVYSRRVQQMGFNGRYVFARIAYSL
jgi:iron complex outermembrane recepter protein